MSRSPESPLHMIDIIRKKRDGACAQYEREIEFVAQGAASDAHSC